MRDYSDKAIILDSATDAAAGRGFVSAVLRQVSGAAAAPRPACEFLVTRIANAATHERPDAALDFIEELGRVGITDRELYDTYIPGAARHLGAEWCNDITPFTLVTLGCARLQHIARLVGERLVEAAGSQATTAHVLLALPREEDHTLGLLMAAQTLRAEGCVVYTLLQAGPDDIARTIERHNFDMIGLSAAGRPIADSVIRIATAVRNVTDSPLMLGGHILALEPDLVSAAGCTHACRKPVDALTFLKQTTTTDDLQRFAPSMT